MSTTSDHRLPPTCASIVAAGLRSCAIAAVVPTLGLLVGAATLCAQGRLHGAPAALANSESAWLLAPFAAGLLVRSTWAAALAGFIACVLQLVGYDACAQWRGDVLAGSMDGFWVVAAAISGPVFGLAGWVSRHGAPVWRGLGPSMLAAAFAAEGVWAYGHVLREPSTTLLWLAIAATVAVVGLRGVRGWRWLALTLPLALAVQIEVSRLCLGRAW